MVSLFLARILPKCHDFMIDCFIILLETFCSVSDFLAQDETRPESSQSAMWDNMQSFRLLVTETIYHK